MKYISMLLAGFAVTINTSQIFAASSRTETIFCPKTIQCKGIDGDDNCIIDSGKYSQPWFILNPGNKTATGTLDLESSTYSLHHGIEETDYSVLCNYRKKENGVSTGVAIVAGMASGDNFAYEGVSVNQTWILWSGDNKTSESMICYGDKCSFTARIFTP